MTNQNNAAQALADLLELAPRAEELATRLVAAGPKAAHVSASETHEIADFVHSAIAVLSMLRTPDLTGARIAEQHIDRIRELEAEVAELRAPVAAPTWGDDYKHDARMFQRKAVAAPVADGPVPYPKREDVTPEMRASFERLFSEARKHHHGTLARNEQGAYRDLRVDADWVFYQRAWADALASAPVTHYECGRSNGDGTYAAVPVRAPVAGEAPPTDWQNALRIAELPEVDEALAVFCNDGTLDNAVGLAQAILDAAPQVSDGVLPAPCHDLRYHDQYRIGWNRCLDACRAALAAQPAEKPATSAPSPAASQHQAMVPGSRGSGNSHTDGGAIYE